MIPVYVPSKGRNASSATLRSLRAEGFTSVTICSPDAEVDTYAERWKQTGWSVIGQGSSPGIQGARQAILETARKRDEPWIWMLDDDTTGVFLRSASGKFYRATYAEAMGIMERTVKTDFHGVPVLMAGPQFRQYAWSGPPVEQDVHLRNFIMMAPLAGFDYWPFVKEDLDMVLQVLQAGGSTLRFNSVAFDSPKMGTLAGGCSDDYAAGALEQASEALVEKWPGIVSMRLNEKTGYVENRVNWRAAREA